MISFKTKLSRLKRHNGEFMEKVLKVLGCSVTSAILLFSTSVTQSSPIQSFEYNLDTTSFTGQSVIFEIDLIDGAPTPSEITFDAPEVDGIAIGSGGNITDTSFFNFVEYPITLGEQLTFSFSLVATQAPSTGFFPDSFSLFMLDSSYLPLFGTSDPTGADSLLQWDLGVGDPIAFAGTVDTVNVNEPSMLLLLMLLPSVLFGRKVLRIAFLTASLAISSAAIAEPSGTGTTDLTAEVEISQGGLRLNRQTRTFDGVITINNLDGNTLSGDLILAVYDLPEGVLLTNATYTLPDGIPYVSLAPTSDIEVGETTRITLKFLNQTRSAFSANFRLLALQEPISNEALVLGPDANEDGVRDDLEPLVEDRYDDEGEKAAASQVLSAIRSSLTESGSEESSFNALLTFHKAQDCLYTKFDLDQAEVEAEYLRDISMNSRERIEAWIMLFNAAAGQSIPISNPNPCAQ